MSDTATLEAPKKKQRLTGMPPLSSGPAPCVGLPVQYHTRTETLPAILQRQSKADPSLWDVKVFLSGASIPVLRVGVLQADEVKVGCWSLLPGWGG